MLSGPFFERRSLGGEKKWRKYHKLSTSPFTSPFNADSGDVPWSR